MPGSTNEEVRQEPHKAVYRSADQDSVEALPVVAPRQKIPGE
jgi:hypothetical protein